MCFSPVRFGISNVSSDNRSTEHFRSNFCFWITFYPFIAKFNYQGDCMINIRWYQEDSMAKRLFIFAVPIIKPCPTAKVFPITQTRFVAINFLFLLTKLRQVYVLLKKNL